MLNDTRKTAILVTTKSSNQKWITEAIVANSKKLKYNILTTCNAVTLSPLYMAVKNDYNLSHINLKSFDNYKTWWGDDIRESIVSMKFTAGIWRL